MMKITQYYISLLCACLISAGCISSHPKVVDASTENNPDLVTDKQGQSEKDSPENIAAVNKTIILELPATEISSKQQTKPDLSGTWILNKELSDNPQEKFKEIKPRAGKSGGHGQSGKGSGGRRGGGKKNSNSGGKGGGGGRGSLPQDLQQLLNASETLELKHEEPLLTIMTKDGQRQRVFTDFRGARISASGGMHQKVITAGWESDVLVVEITTNSASLVQRYKLHTVSRQLWIRSVILISSIAKPVQFNRVYELAETKTLN